jgi:hypothetical protein
MDLPQGVRPKALVAGFTAAHPATQRLNVAVQPGRPADDGPSPREILLKQLAVANARLTGTDHLVPADGNGSTKGGRQ